MDATRAKRDAEAQRYRLQVRLAVLAEVAKKRGDVTASIEATRLRKAVDGVTLGTDEVRTGGAKQAFTALEPQVTALQHQLGIQPYAAPLMPKWMRLVTFAAPVIAFLMVAFIWFERRRRKRAVDEAALEKLDRG